MRENIKQSVKLFDELVKRTERKDFGKPCQSYVRAEIVYRKGTDSPFSGPSSRRGFRLRVYAVTIGDRFESVTMDVGNRYCTHLTEFVREVKMFSTKVLAELANDKGILQRAHDMAQSVALAEQARVRQAMEREATYASAV